MPAEQPGSHHHQLQRRGRQPAFNSASYQSFNHTSTQIQQHQQHQVDRFASNDYLDSYEPFAKTEKCGSNSDAEDNYELEAIFDDLFGKNPEAIDLFCNQVIEDEIAAATVEATPSNDGQTSPVFTSAQTAAAISPTQTVPTQPPMLTSPSPPSSNCSASPSLCSSSSTTDSVQSSAQFDPYTFEWTDSNGLVDGVERDAMFCATTSPPPTTYSSESSETIGSNLLEEEPEQLFNCLGDEDTFDYELSWSPSSTSIDQPYSNLLEVETSSNSITEHDYYTESEAIEQDGKHEHHQFFSPSSSHPSPIEFNEFVVL